MSCFCAICLDERGPFESRPLGKNDAMVKVCRDCDEQPAEYKNGPVRGYDLDASNGVTWSEFKDRVQAFAFEASPAGEQIIRQPYASPNMRSVTPGWLMLRVRRRDASGRPRDMREATQTFAREPWAREVHYIGTDSAFHVFERPDPNLAKNLRTASHNPIAWLEQFKTEAP